MNARRRLRRQLSILTLAAFSVATTVRAHEGHHHNAMGTVKAVDTAKLDLETQEGKLESFVLTDKTAYKRGDAVATHHDVAVGERAVVMYQSKEGKNVAIEVKLGAKKSEQASAMPSLREVDPRYVCMINDALFDREQIPVAVEGKTYYGCCPMCKERLTRDAAARTAVDPVSGRVVDKATARIAARPDGTVLYFESAETLAQFRKGS